MFSVTVNVTEPLKFDPESEEEDEVDAEGEPETQSAKQEGTLGAVELAEIIDSYSPCFSSMDIQTRSAFKTIPPTSKRMLSVNVKRPTRRSPRKLPNAGSYIPEEQKKESESVAVK